MTPVEESKSMLVRFMTLQVEGTESAEQRHVLEADVEIRQGDLKRLERVDKCFKHFLDSDFKTANKKI